MKLKSSFKKLNEYVKEHAKIRFKNAQIENQYHNLFKDINELTDVHTVQSMQFLSNISSQMHKIWIENKKSIEEDLSYETQNHLTWIETVIDILNRRQALKERLDWIEREFKNASDKSAVEHDYGNEKITLQNRIDRMTEGIYRELKLLKAGSDSFMKNKLNDQFIKNQVMFDKNALELFSNYAQNDDEYSKEFDQTFGRGRCESDHSIKTNVFNPTYNNYDDEEEEKLDTY